MKYQVLFIVSLLATTAAKSQSNFPAVLIGNWKGTLLWYQPGKSTPQNVPMELRIQPNKDSVGQYTWNLIYGVAKEDNRPYILQPVDTTKGHWSIDERNGIILDQYWLGNKFSGSFSVGKSTIVNSYWIEKGQLHVEFFSLSTDAIATTGEGTEESPRVLSYALRGYQKAILSKQ